MINVIVDDVGHLILRFGQLHEKSPVYSFHKFLGLSSHLNEYQLSRRNMTAGEADVDTFVTET